MSLIASEAMSLRDTAVRMRSQATMDERKWTTATAGVCV